MLSSRHFTKLCMFAVIYYLLALQANWARVPSYDSFAATLQQNNKQIRQYSKFEKELNEYHNARDGMTEHCLPYTRKMEFIIARTDSLYNDLDNLKNIANAYDRQKKRKKRSGKLVSAHDKNTIVKKLNRHQLMVINSIDSYDKDEVRAFHPHWNDDPLLNKITSIPELGAIVEVYKNDLAIIEKIAIHMIRREGGYSIRKFDNIQVLALPYEQFALPGQKITTHIFLGAYAARHVERTGQVVYTDVKGDTIKSEYGVGTLSIPAGQLGQQHVSGKAFFTRYHTNVDQSRSEITKYTSHHEFPWAFEYLVTAPGISMQLNNTNICYVGIKNPITISVPGYADDKLSLKVAGAKVTNISDGHYNIFFNKMPKEKTYAFVDATNAERTTSTVGSLPLSIKELPLPIARIAGVNNGYIRLRDLKNAEGISVSLEQCDFEMDYTIVSYKISLLHKRNTIYIEPVKVKGAYFRNSTAAMRIIDMVQHGDKVIFEDIVTKDRNGRIIELAPMILKPD